MNLASGCLWAECLFGTWLPQTRIPLILCVQLSSLTNAEACETTGLSGAAAPGRGGVDAEAAAAGLCLCHGVGAMALKKRPEGGEEVEQRS